MISQEPRGEKIEHILWHNLSDPLHSSVQNAVFFFFFFTRIPSIEGVLSDVNINSVKLHNYWKSKSRSYITLETFRWQSCSLLISWTLVILCLSTWLLDRSEVLFCFQVCERRLMFLSSKHQTIFHSKMRDWGVMSEEKRGSNDQKRQTTGDAMFIFLNMPLL